ncbi:M20 metallopeptidase family protein [Alteraurantiacibacter aquimixticola]|uniref:Amidohydrolase n=1 Tax=Alteraurantiacibacter aquimixticola TaxID=2489173 RepID=A0A4T3EZR3_9SPHN|nr:M20 family metallopeptidase [Alteraurantiacibacter aquimixticola]TIX49064.1 amidohydrolase [Alteraurantiacibacter aquimixticola]
MLTENLLSAARAIEPRITALRRAIHAEPELGLETPLTLAKVRTELADLPLEWREGTSATGAVAVLKGGKPGKAALLRGDMDALPMQEETGLPFASTIAGRMHACGHDTHTAMLAGAARILADQREALAGEVQFMFQPGEEGFHGARYMIEDGLLDPLPDAAFALHIMPNSPHGVLAGKPGAMLAAADQFDITVTGRGGHASMPHDTRDPIPAAAEIVLALQAMVTRRFAAAEATVVTVSQMNAGTAHNIIGDTAMLRGTIRTLSAERRLAVREAMREVAEGVAAAHGCSAKVEIAEGFPVTLNDARAVDLARAVATEMGGAQGWHDMAHSLMGAEDFSYVLEKVPGAMLFLGVAEEGADWKSCCSIHSNRMMVDESVLPKGSAFLAACAMKFLEEGWG